MFSFSKRNLSKLLLVTGLGLCLCSCAHRKASENANVSKAKSETAQKAQQKSDKTSNDDDFIVENDTTQSSNTDPYESYNRKMFAFNRGVDKVVMRPLAKSYQFVVPNPVQRCVNNFFNNLSEISHICNDILQVNFRMAGHDSSRLLLNSTVGVFGLIDVASYIGVQRHEQDTGLTFAKWGAKKSPYFVLPFLGPSTIRDTIGLAPNFFYLSAWPHINPKEERYVLLGGNVLDTRVQLLKTDKLVDQSFDPYIFVRNAYLQHRDYLIHKNSEVDEDPFVNLDHAGNGWSNDAEADSGRSITR